MAEPYRLKVFLCHASADKPVVRELYHRLCKDGVDPWLDEKCLLPGKQWKEVIPKAVRDSDIVLVCLSKTSADKDGYVQKEIKFALDKADEKPEGSIYIIPLKLEECRVPDRLSDWQWVNYYDADGYDRLLSSFREHARYTAPDAPKLREDSRTEKQQTLNLEIEHRLTRLPVLLEDIFTFTQLHTAKGAVHGKAEYHPRVGKLGDFEPLFVEYQGQSLFYLIWELNRIIADEEKVQLKGPLEAAKRLPSFFDKLVLLVPAGAEDSKWQMDRNMVEHYKESLKALDISRWNAGRVS